MLFWSNIVKYFINWLFLMLVKNAEYGMEIGRMYAAELSSVLANKVKGTPH